MDTNRDTQTLSFRRFLVFWSPLAVTWVLMAAEGPFLAAVIARLPDAKANLGAFGVAFGLAIFIEAPIIMLLSASNALVRDQHSYRMMRLFSYGLCAILTVLMVLFTQTPAYEWVAFDLMELPPDVARLAHGGLTLLIPWPGLVGIRRFYQGILIRHQKTRWVGMGTVVRLSTIAASGLALYHFSDWPGVWVGDLSMTLGVGAEALFSGLACQPTIRVVRKQQPADPSAAPLTIASISTFYYPLALTSLISFMVTSISSFFLAHSREPINSLAVMPVINSFAFLFNGVSVSLQEVSVALLDSRFALLKQIRIYGYAVAGVSTLLMYLILVTPLNSLWFAGLAGLPTDLIDFALVPALIMGALPMLTAWMSIQRGILVAARATGPVSHATIIEVASAVSLMALTLNHWGWIGAIGASFASIIGRVIGNVWLVPVCAKVVRRSRG